MKFECPVCKAELVHKRIDDGFDTHRIHKDGTTEFIASHSNGCDEVYCSINADHKIPDKLAEAVMELL